MDQIKTGKLINGLCSLPCRYTGQEGLCGIVQNMGLCIRNCRVIPENSRPVAFNFIGNSNSRQAASEKNCRGWRPRQPERVELNVTGERCSPLHLVLMCFSKKSNYRPTFAMLFKKSVKL